MEDGAPVIRYGPPEEPEEPDDGGRGTGWVGRILLVLTWAILLFCLLVWAIVGAIFWVPLMARTMVTFSVALIQATLEGGRPTAAAQTLRDAVTFYRRGFVIAVDAVMREDAGDRKGGVPVQPKRLLKEVAWAVLVWYGVFFGLGWIAYTPMDLWASLTSWPWGDWASSAVDSVRGLFGGTAPDTTAAPLS